MFRRPILANCQNGSRPRSRYGGEPDDWFSPNTFADSSLGPIGFDFFVDWSRSPPIVKKLFLVKRVADRVPNPCTLGWVQRGAEACHDDIELYRSFAHRHDLRPAFAFIPTTANWATAPENVVLWTMNEEEEHQFELEDLKDLIRQLSGGPVRVGFKGLFYGTSGLECHLSQTDALWPGDADCLLVDKRTGEAQLLLEFKKHSMGTPMRDQQLSNYIAKDHRKWYRLALLRDKLNVPLKCVYYSTESAETLIKVEDIIGSANAPVAGNSYLIDIKGLSHKQIAQAIIG